MARYSSNSSGRPYQNNKVQQNNYVDINSSNQVSKVYKKKGRARRVISFLLSLVLLVFGCGMVYYYNLLGSIVYQPTATEASGETSEDNTDLSIGGDSGQLLSDSKVLNVMLFGQDNNEGGGYGRSDTMILLSIDNRHKKMKLTSFMRDTYVTIPGYYNSKLNSAYSLGGAALAMKTIEANFGVRIDRYAIVDFDSFKSIIDTLGGVDMDLTQDEIDYINYQTYINNQSSERYEITDSEGIVHLNGRQALWYARNRGFDEAGHDFVVAGDDFDRTQRQRKLLNTMVSEMKGADAGQIVKIVSDVGPLITTNFKKEEITTLLTQALKYLGYNMEEFTVPPEGTWSYDRNEAGSVILINDLSECRKQYTSFIYEELVSGTGTAETTDNE